MHIEQPTEKVDFIKSFDDIEKARKVLGNRDRIEVYLNENKAALSKLKDEVTNWAEELKTRINFAKDEAMKEISKTEREIEKKCRVLKQNVEKYLFQVGVSYPDVFLKEAFDTSKLFACTEIIRGEMSKDCHISACLVQLHIPPYLKTSDAEPPQQAVQGPGYQLPKANPSLPQSAQSQPLARKEASAIDHSLSNLQIAQPQRAQYPIADRGHHQVQPTTNLSERSQAIPPSSSQSQCDQSQVYQYSAVHELAQRPPATLLQNQFSLPAKNVGMQYQETSSAQMGTGSFTRQEQWQSTVSSHFEITEEMKSNIHAPCREDFYALTPEIPTTIGRHRLPIESLQGEFKWNELMARKIQFLSEKYSSWRRSRGDGNCFYRCVGVLLCEHYCRPDTQRAEIATIYKEMIEQAQHFQMISNSPEILGYIKMWQRLVKDICNTRTLGENAFQRLQYFLQRPKFDKAIIVAIRNYTASYIRIHANDPGVSEFLPEGPEPVIREIMEYGTEAEGIVLKFAAQAFNITLHILTVDNKSEQSSETTYGPAVGGWYPSIHLLHLPGHYNYLVPRAWDAADCYDFASNTYNPVSTQISVDYEEYVPI